MIALIACVDMANGIGKNGSIPWKLKEDMQRFKKMTSGNTIIMGRLTWESIGSKPLPNRSNIVITSKPELIENSRSYSDIGEAILSSSSFLKSIYMIGGSGIYKESLLFGASKVYLTRIYNNYECDTFFPFESMKGFESEIGEWLVSESGIRYRYETYYR